MDRNQRAAAKLVRDAKEAERSRRRRLAANSLIAQGLKQKPVLTREQQDRKNASQRKYMQQLRNDAARLVTFRLRALAYMRTYRGHADVHPPDEVVVALMAEAEAELGVAADEAAEADVEAEEAGADPVTVTAQPPRAAQKPVVKRWGRGEAWLREQWVELQRDGPVGGRGADLKSERVRKLPPRPNKDNLPEVEVRPTGYAGDGLFAKGDIEAFSWVCLYGAVNLDDADSVTEQLRRGNDKIVYLSKLRAWCDGRRSRHKGPAVNFACECCSNCSFAVDYNETTRKYECWIVSKVDIKAGVELTWDYGYRWDKTMAGRPTLTWLKWYVCPVGKSCKYHDEWYCNTTAGKKEAATTSGREGRNAAAAAAAVAARLAKPPTSGAPNKRARNDVASVPPVVAVLMEDE
jgi:SET domain